MITGTGSIATVGAGNLVLHGSNGFTRLSVNSGMVTFGSNTARRVEGIALAHRAMLAAGTAGFVLANAIITGCAETLNNGTGSFILNGAISGPGSIAKVGSGILVFKATTALLGLAWLGIKTGTVTVGSSTAAGSGTVAFAGARCSRPAKAA